MSKLRDLVVELIQTWRDRNSVISDLHDIVMAIDEQESGTGDAGPWEQVKAAGGLCVECGPVRSVDKDGCCGCGNAATGQWLHKTLYGPVPAEPTGNTTEPTLASLQEKIEGLEESLRSAMHQRYSIRADLTALQEEQETHVKAWHIAPPHERSGEEGTTDDK